MPRARALLPLLCCLFVSACQSYYPVRVQVLDAETHQPIPAATVEADYMTELTAADVYVELIFKHTAGPKPTTALTDSSGFAVLPVSDFRARHRGAEARADGYLPSKAFFNAAHFDQIRQRPEVTAPGPPDLTIELYSGPHPTIRFVVPDGYRGLLRIDGSAPTTARSFAPGERVAEIPVVQPPTPQKVPWYNLGHRHSPQPWHFTARYANGTPLPNDRQNPATDAIAFRHVSGFNLRDIFVIGTAADRQAARAQIRELVTDFDKLWNAPNDPAH